VGTEVERNKMDGKKICIIGHRVDVEGRNGKDFWKEG
jgi:hypothetical protein